MGHELYREIRDGDTAGWTPAELLVALLIADDANDKTRRGWIPVSGCPRRGRWVDGLTEQSGLKRSGITAALRRLAQRGYEFRLPISTDKNGRPVFAAKGHAIDWQVPRIPPRQPPKRVDAGPSNTQRVDAGPSNTQRVDAGPPSGGQRVDGGDAKGRPGSTPSPQNLPSVPSLSGSLFDRFSAVVPGGVEREQYELLTKVLQNRATVDSYVAVINAAIRDGYAADLIKEVEADPAASNGHHVGPRTEACKSGAHRDCAYDWCTCGCHQGGL